MFKTMTGLAIGLVLAASPAFAQNPPDPTAPKSTLRHSYSHSNPLPLSRKAPDRFHQHAAHRSGIRHRQSSIRANQQASRRQTCRARGQGPGPEGPPGQAGLIDRILTKAAGEKLQQEIDRAALEIQYAKQSADRELSTLNDDLMNEFSLKVQPVVEGIRAEKQLWAVFVMNENLAAMMPGLDVSGEVVRRLDGKK
jgi:hypothetical protein